VGGLVHVLRLVSFPWLFANVCTGVVVFLSSFAESACQNKRAPLIHQRSASRSGRQNGICDCVSTSGTAAS
jgi:hypothetical protein